MCGGGAQIVRRMSHYTQGVAESLTPVVSRLLLTAAVALFFVASWIVLPAPTRLLLPLAVGAPELAHWRVVIGLGLGGATLATPHSSTMVRTTMALAIVATMLAAAPLMRAGPRDLGRRHR